MNKRKLKHVTEISSRQFRRRVCNTVMEITKKIKDTTTHKCKIIFYCNTQLF